MPSIEPRWLTILRMILSIANLVPEIVVPVLGSSELKALIAKNKEQEEQIAELKSREFVSSRHTFEAVAGDADPRLIKSEEFPVPKEFSNS